MRGTDAVLMQRFLEELPHLERNILVLHYVEELSNEEIAMVLKISSDQVRSTLAEIRGAARTCFVQPAPSAMAG